MYLQGRTCPGAMLPTMAGQATWNPRFGSGLGTLRKGTAGIPGSGSLGPQKLVSAAGTALTSRMISGNDVGPYFPASQNPRPEFTQTSPQHLFVESSILHQQSILSTTVYHLYEAGIRARGRQRPKSTNHPPTGASRTKQPCPSPQTPLGSPAHHLQPRSK